MHVRKDLTSSIAGHPQQCGIYCKHYVLASSISSLISTIFEAAASNLQDKLTEYDIVVINKWQYLYAMG